MLANELADFSGARLAGKVCLSDALGNEALKTLMTGLTSGSAEPSEAPATGPGLPAIFLKRCEIQRAGYQTGAKRIEFELALKLKSDGQE